MGSDRLRSLGLLAVVSPDTTRENEEVTVLSRGECESISDLVLGGNGRTCTKMVKFPWSWLLDKMLCNGWVPSSRWLEQKFCSIAEKNIGATICGIHGYEVNTG